MIFVKLLPFVLLAISLNAADVKSEIDTIVEAMYRAAAAHDVDAYAKFLTSDFHLISRKGKVLDRQEDLADVRNGSFSAVDIKTEEISTSVYGDTVLQIRKELWTTSTGKSRTALATRVFVKQNGSWRLAFFSHSDIAPVQ